MNQTYNGWKNRQTWNVALWIGNDEGLYNMAVSFARSSKGRPVYRRFVEYAGLAGGKTPDGIAWDDSKLDYRALTDLLAEFKGE